MRRSFSFRGLVGLWLLLGCSVFGAAQAQPASLAIQGTTVVEVADGSLAPGQTVLVQNNRIVAVGPSGVVTIPADTEVVEADGTYLIPGLWDMHAHALASYREVGPFFNALVANGVTGIRDPQHSSRALGAMVAPATAVGAMPGPVRIVVAGNLVDGPNPAWPGSQVAATPAEGRAVVDSLAGAGVPFIKVYSRVPPETYLAIAERARELGLPFVGHVPMGVSAATASDAGQRSIEHLVGGVMLGCTSEEEGVVADLSALAVAAARGDTTVAPHEAIGRYMAALSAPLDEERCRALLARFAANETWQVPTLVPAWAFALASDSALAADPRTRYVPRDGALSYWHGYFERIPPLALEWYERQRRIAGMLEEHDVPLLIGTDMPAVPMVFPGFSVHDELRLLVETGLSPTYVLQAATLNPAVFFGMADSLGTVEAGKLADLVLLEANPLEDIANTQRIRAVVANGRLYRRDHLDALLEGAAAESARRSLSVLLSEALEERDFVAVRELYDTLKEAAPDTVSFGVWELSDLGHSLLDSGLVEEATAVFGWNVVAHPASPYAYGAFAEALVRMKRNEAAVEMYRQAVDVARESGHPTLAYFRAQRERLKGSSDE